jgi:hypothetical protein
MTDALTPLIGRTFTLFEKTWSTGYPGISDYRARLILRWNQGQLEAEIQTSYLVERSGIECDHLVTPATFTGIGKDGTPRLKLGTTMPWGPMRVKIHPEAGTFDVAVTWCGFRECRALALSPEEHASFDARALGCLRAICRSWEPGFEIPPVRAARTDLDSKQDERETIDRSGFIEGNKACSIMTEFKHTRSVSSDSKVHQIWVRKFVVRGLEPPAVLYLTLVQRQVGDGPWSSEVCLGDVHDQEFVPKAIEIFNNWFSPANG